MHQTCQHCGYESPAGARFCRQCGAPLFAETEASVASTRNYGKQEPAPSTAGSSRLPPSVADVVAGETERYYQPSYVPAPPSPVTAPIKRGIKLWRWMIAFLFVLLIGAAIGAMMRGPRRVEAPRPPEEFARIQREREARRRQDDLRRQAEDRMREAEDRARQAQDRARQALDRAREASERASEAGAVLAPTDEKLLDLSQYEYPGATTGSAIRIPGREMLVLRTPSGDFDAVNQFYRKKLGEPIIEINEPMEKRLIFQSNTTPAISVSVETDRERPGPLLKIVVVRSPFRIPAPDETRNRK